MDKTIDDLDKREAFETAIVQIAEKRQYRYMDSVLERDTLGNYSTTWVDSAWIGWQAAHTEYRAAIQEFVDRCDRGEIRSRYTYAKFKALLAGAPVAQQPESEPVAFEVGGYYQTQGGDWVKFVSVHNQGTDYETMADETGVHRYTKRPGDMGRVTGTAHDYSDLRNTPPLYAGPHPSPHVPEGWLPMGMAPKDGTVVQLLVQKSELPSCIDAEEEGELSRSIGCNGFDNDGEDHWQVVGWSWNHDCFTKVRAGAVAPVGWAPMAPLCAALSVPENMAAQMPEVQ